ncbi:UPF0449 protein C19orf25 homolog [Cephus cinctus]|uniref:UPF0449 protein C19orf25 homolog n=1 Tax=Cephus cinctus TaxID=211228 RepID=A0AAJ7C8X8_CEPCN|nr:UPF0449 protein C19orf25 homolog [Cephus cinctus]
MFGNKKNNLPPRPHPPAPEQILEDLQNSNISDICFKILSKGEPRNEDLHFPMNTNDPENVYRKVKTYLDVNRRLEELNESLHQESNSLRSADQEMKRLVQDIRNQALEALVKISSDRE